MKQQHGIAGTIEREQARLRRFIRSRVPDKWDAEDILQDVFFELAAAYRLMEPIEHAGAWLFRVARNRITDLFRKKKSEALEDVYAGWQDLLPSADAGPDAAYARRVLIDALEEALAELPALQREVFLAHELEGRSFKELAAESGLSVNTLLSRKHYAVRHLRRRLQKLYDEFTKG